MKRYQRIVSWAIVVLFLVGVICALAFGDALAFPPTPPGGTGLTNPLAADITAAGHNITGAGSVGAASVSIGATVFTPLAAAPSSPVADAWYLADGVNWNPDTSNAGGVPYWVTYCATCGAGSTPKYTAFMDDHGNLLTTGVDDSLVTFSFDGGGSAIPTSNTKRCKRIHSAATIKGYSLLMSVSSSSTFAVTFGTFSTSVLPTGDLTGGHNVTTVGSAALGKIDDTLTDWTIAIPAGDVVCAECTVNSNATWATLTLHGK